MRQWLKKKLSELLCARIRGLTAQSNLVGRVSWRDCEPQPDEWVDDDWLARMRPLSLNGGIIV